MAADPRTVTVRLPERSYDIRVQTGLLHNAGHEIAAISKTKRVFVVTDDTVRPLHAQPLLDSFKAAGIEAKLFEIPAGESHKTLATVATIYHAMLEARIERSTVVVGLGGGVIGDMAGFAASTILRGVPFVQIPTTLLAMVDASVGGKTGFNHASGKNLIGTFYHPIAVLIDPATLLTLPPSTLSEGLAECIKHEIIRDAAGFESLKHQIHRALQLDLDYLAELIAHNVSIKARVVEADPTERGERAHLNLGHTFGHAIEKVSQFTVSHGVAVALGICAAARVAMELGLLTDEDRVRIERLLQSANLPTRAIGDLDLDAVIDAMHSDKKVEGGTIRLVLPQCIGHATIRGDVSPKIIRHALQSIL